MSTETRAPEDLLRGLLKDALERGEDLGDALKAFTQGKAAAEPDGRQTMTVEPSTVTVGPNGPPAPAPSPPVLPEVVHLRARYGRQFVICAPTISARDAMGQSYQVERGFELKFEGGRTSVSREDFEKHVRKCPQFSGVTREGATERKTIWLADEAGVPQIEDALRPKVKQGAMTLVPGGREMVPPMPGWDAMSPSEITAALGANQVDPDIGIAWEVAHRNRDLVKHACYAKAMQRETPAGGQAAEVVQGQTPQPEVDSLQAPPPSPSYDALPPEVQKVIRDTMVAEGVDIPDEFGPPQPETDPSATPVSAEGAGSLI